MCQSVDVLIGKHRKIQNEPTRARFGIVMGDEREHRKRG